MVNFRLMNLNLHLMSQDKQENIQKKLQGCISKGEGGASLDVPVMFKFADCKMQKYNKNRYFCTISKLYVSKFSQ